MSIPSVRNLLLLLLLLALPVALAACGSKDEPSGSTSASGGDSTVALADCTPDSMQTNSAGTLTIATDKPAYPPYFEDDDPTNGKGFESAVGFAIADKLGFSPDAVKWTTEAFNASYSPGPKDFDFDLNEISITPKRAEQVDFSSPYYTADQAVVALPESSAGTAHDLEDLADAKIGVQIGTTSLDAVTASIEPNGQVDAVVVDTPTALYLTAAQVPDAKIIGEFPAPGGDSWGALLEKDSPLTGCVSAAVDELKSSGELDKIQQQWINASGGVPTLE